MTLLTKLVLPLTRTDTTLHIYYDTGAEVTAYELSASRRCDSTVLSAYYYQHVCGAQWGKNMFTFTLTSALINKRCIDVVYRCIFQWAVRRAMLACSTGRAVNCRLLCQVCCSSTRSYIMPATP
jgi:hypothetical protein